MVINSIHNFWMQILSQKVLKKNYYIKQRQKEVIRTIKAINNEDETKISDKSKIEGTRH